MTSPYTPPGWPTMVRPPAVAGWEASATAFLLDCCPPDFRSYRVLRNHPVVLAQFARQFTRSQAETAQDGLAEVRAALQRSVPAPVLEEAAQAWLAEGARLARVRRAVDLVGEALHGKAFVPRL